MENFIHIPLGLLVLVVALVVFSLVAAYMELIAGVGCILIVGYLIFFQLVPFVGKQVYNVMFDKTPTTLNIKEAKKEVSFKVIKEQ